MLLSAYWLDSDRQTSHCCFRQVESMSAQATEQQRSAQESELNFTRRLRQVESAQAAASEAEGQAVSQAQRAELAADMTKQALLKAQTALQETKIKLHTQQQDCIKLQVRLMSVLMSELISAGLAARICSPLY